MVLNLLVDLCCRIQIRRDLKLLLFTGNKGRLVGSVDGSMGGKSVGQYVIPVGSFPCFRLHIAGYVAYVAVRSTSIH